MAFWGVEIKPGKPYSHQFDITRGRLHISQATLGVGTSSKRSLVQCNVGDKSPIFLCSLMPDKVETSTLDFEFEEDEEVVFSVLGPRSVHLCGYYHEKVSGCDGHKHDDESDSFGEDIGETDSEQSSDFDSVDEFEGEFSDDDEDIGMFSPSRRPNRGVVIEEILEDEKPTNENGDRSLVAVSNMLAESEDEDGFPISKPDKKLSKASKKKAKGGSDKVIGAKRKSQDGETERGDEKPNASLPCSEVGEGNVEKPRKKKKKERTKEGKTHALGEDNVVDVHREEKAQMEEEKAVDITLKEPVRDEAAKKPSNDKSVEVAANHVADEDKNKKKKKNKKNKTQESDVVANTEETKKGSVVEIEGKNAEVKARQTRSYDNGLIVEELDMGKPDGKRASLGNKVSVNYIGKLKKNGKIFDSNIRGCNAPFQFRLGVGEVIKGWDVGVNGMRIGDKRRLTIPPSMGYGSKGAPPSIPPNAWLVFDVELVAVR